MRNSNFQSGLHRGSSPHQEVKHGLDRRPGDRIPYPKSELQGYLDGDAAGCWHPDRLTDVH
jgi:hypothetical protein